MASLTTQKIVKGGLTPTYAAAAAGGDTVDPGTGFDVFVHLKNTDAAARTVTVNSIAACSQGFDHDLAINVPATTGDVMIGPLDRARFGRSSDGRVELTYSAVTGLTVGAFSLVA